MVRTLYWPYFTRPNPFNLSKRAGSSWVIRITLDKTTRTFAVPGNSPLGAGNYDSFVPCDFDINSM
ncbi:hypothetical protein TRIP_C90415 [Candidatus Zixiibacteriota bacterium]|nr:hypothetical protein TRIP_C90415 [candidate division Zixibacteria bacterium]